jgi:hypothetical protein
MPKVMTQLAIFFLLLNLSIGVLTQTGVAADLGMQTTVAGDERIEQANETARSIEPGTESQDTLFGMYTRVTNAISTILGTVTAGPTMLKQLGFPKAITDMLGILFVVIYGLGLAQFIRGFNL